MAVWREWMAGLQLVKRQRVLAALFAVLGVAMLGDSMITVLIVPLVKTLLGGGALQLGWLMTAQGIGGIAGGVLAGQLGKVVLPRRLITLGLSATALTVLALLSLPFLPVTLAFMAVIGVVSMSLDGQRLDSAARRASAINIAAGCSGPIALCRRSRA